jgi:hypothetical protein
MSLWSAIKDTFGFGDQKAAHPALESFNRPLEMGKHVLKKTLKFALVGAAVFAVGAALPMALGAASPIGWALSALGVNVGSGIVAAAGNAALFGAGLGAVAGVAKGALGMEEAAQKDEQQRILSYDRGVQRARSDMMFNQQVASSRGLVPPSVPMGAGRGAEVGR